MMVSVLIPTCDRLTGLAATLAALTAQTFRNFEVIISDQGEEPITEDPTLQSLVRILEHGKRGVSLLNNLPRRGMAQQRQFLLDHARGGYSLFLDDDVILEPDALQRLVTALKEEQCGFAGMAPVGLSYRNDVRPHEQHLELWNEAVHPELIRPGSSQWKRHQLHNAANMLHVAQQFDGNRKYKVAWVGGCVLYDTRKLWNAGAFEFWRDLPAKHCGEDVMVQLRLLERYGGFGLLPSGAYHQELPTRVRERRVDAPLYLLSG